MPNNQIKGLTVEIGGDTSKLGEALESVDKKSRSISSELGSINKLLKLDPTNTELLAQKQQILGDAISNTEEKLQILKEAEKQAQAQFEKGDISAEQYRALQREVIATEAKLNQYKNAVEETAQAAENLSDSTDQAARGLKGQKEEAKDAERATDDLDDSMADAAKTGFAALIAAASATIAAIAALAESTREYRTEMSKLDTAFRDANFSSSAANKTYKELQGILGETDQAVEAANHLAMLCTTEEELAEWTDILTGVYAKFGASLQPEALSEAANETARCGTVTGAFADALNWAAAEGETFGVTMKENTEQNEEWNKAVAEATTAEDYFNLALQECSSVQERQQLITKTLTKLYQGAATQYKKTNSELIRANKSNDEWNATLAECGEVVEPVVTDVKELGTALLKSAKQPLKDVATYIRGTFLPNLTKTGTWAKQNLPEIAALTAGVTATIVLYKAAALSAEMATKGLTLATIAQKVAQEGLNFVMNANPYVLLATGIVAATTAVAALSLATKETKERVDPLTESERELMAAADAAAESFREQKKATEDALGDISTEMDHTQKLANELGLLADESGKVAEKDQARADLILGLLNEALGTEYEMVDGVIQKYSELKTGINEVIKSKTANALLETSNADYVAAIQEEAAAWDNVTLKQKDYEAQLAAANAAQEKAAAAWEWYNTVVQSDGKAAAASIWSTAKKLQNAADAETAALDAKKTAYDDAANNYVVYCNTIANYEAAQTAMLQGNYQQAIDLLKKKEDSYVSYADTVDIETAKVLATLEKEAVDAGIKAESIRKNFEKGVDGYTETMVKEAEDGYKNAMDAFATAYADSFGVGQDLSIGIEVGMEDRRSSLYAKAKGIVSGIISAMRSAADSHSPARKTIEFGEDMGEGTEIGIENKTEDVARAGQRQAEALLDAYRSQEVNGQNALQNVAVRQASLQAGSYMAAGSQNTGVLNKILAAIEKGQVLMIDKDLLIGGTADSYNAKFGQLRMLAERGAL